MEKTVEKNKVMMTIDEFSLMVREKDEWNEQNDAGEGRVYGIIKINSVALYTICKSNTMIGSRKKIIKQFTICWKTIILQCSAAIPAEQDMDTGQKILVRICL